MLQFRKYLLQSLGVFAAGAVMVLGAEAADLPKESEVKAVLLFHLTQFVTWPSISGSEFVIGILGPDPFGSALDAVVKGEKAANLPIRVKRVSRAQDLAGAQLVYVSPRAREPLPRILRELEAQPPSFTVGETAEFIGAGGMLRMLRTPEHKTRIEVNLRRARAAGFNVSAHLLRVSDVVEGGR